MSNFFLSTNWHQYGPYNVFCPVLSDGSKTLTGCAATATAQIVYYWLQQGYSLDLSFKDDDTFYLFDVENEAPLLVDANNVKDYCGATFQELNEVLASFRQDGNFDQNAFFGALNLLAGVLTHSYYDWPSVYGTSGGANRSTFTRFGFQSANTIWYSVHCFESDNILFRKLSEKGFETLGDFVSGGNVVYFEIWNPAHVAVIDGYDPVNKRVHINMGWGGGSNGWYSREDLNNMQLSGFIFDIYPVYDGSPLVISNTNVSGEGSFCRTLQKSSGIETVTEVRFAPSLIGQKIVLNEVASVARTNFSDFNADVRIISDGNLQQHALRIGDKVTFDNFGGSLSFSCEEELSRSAIAFIEGTSFTLNNLKGNIITNAPGGVGHAIFLSPQNCNFSLTMDTGGIFAGNYLVSGATYTDSIEQIQDFLNAYTKNEGEIDQRLIEAATRTAISAPANILTTSVIMMNNRSVIAGTVSLGPGNDVLELHNGSVITGNIYLSDGDNRLVVDNGSVIYGDVWYTNATTEFILSNHSKIYGRLCPTKPNTDVCKPFRIDSSSVIYGYTPFFDKFYITVNSAPVSDFLLNLIPAYSLSGNYTITLTSDLTAGTYKLVSDYSISRKTVVWLDEGSTEEHVLSSSDWDKEFSYNGYTACFSMGDDRESLILTLRGEDVVAGDECGISFQNITGDEYIIEYSDDLFSTALRIKTQETALDTFGFISENFKCRVSGDSENSWYRSRTMTTAADDASHKFVSDADGNTDLFFANAKGTWESGYAAQHTGVLNGSPGTGEHVLLDGKNKLTDVFSGSTDANILVMTDDANGDVLFIDDIYTQFGNDAARFSQIDEIRAGAGDDVVDMTSQRYAYDGEKMTICGGAGNDVIWAAGSDNDLFGDAGNDRIIGSTGFDLIIGGAGNDNLHSGGGNDIFAFCENWGVDTVKITDNTHITLWFASGNENNWDRESRIYRDGSNSVKVIGGVDSTIDLKFGNDGDQYSDMLDIGAFSDAASEKIFEDKNKGLLA